MGLVGQLAHQMGLKTKFMNRFPSTRRGKTSKRPQVYEALRSQSEYYVVSDPAYQDRISGFAFEFYDEGGSLPPDVVGDELLWLTTAVKPGNLAAAARAVFQILEIRASKSRRPLVVMACENMEKASTFLKNEVLSLIPASKNPALLSGYIRESVFFCDTVADRICAEPTLDREGLKDKVAVRVEPFRELIVAQAQLETCAEGRGLINQLHSKGVKFVTQKELDVYWYRKAWCVNGIDLCASVLAKRWDNSHPEAPIVYIDEALKNRVISKPVANVQMEFGNALLIQARKELGVHLDFTLKTIREFNQIVLDRMYNFERNKVAEVIADFTRMAGQDIGDVNEFLGYLDGSNDPELGKLSLPEIEQEIAFRFSKVVESVGVRTFLHKAEHRVAQPTRVLLDLVKSDVHPGKPLPAVPIWSMKYLVDLVKMSDAVAEDGEKEMRKILNDYKTRTRKGLESRTGQVAGANENPAAK